MKYTLIEMVQEILSDLDSDEVNSIDDTVEAQQVANILKNTYNNMISNRDWPHLKRLIQLDSSIDVTKPTHMKCPANMKELTFFRYDNQKLTDTSIRMLDVKYLYPDEFLQFTAGRNQDNDFVQLVTDFSGTKFLINNNTAPKYWTTFDDVYIVCDAYDNEVDSTLQSSKSQCLGYVEPVWVHTDHAVPDLPSEAFAALIEEAKSTAFLVIKQSTNQKAEQNSQRQQAWLSRKAWVAHGGVRYMNYGRRGKK